MPERSARGYQVAVRSGIERAAAADDATCLAREAPAEMRVLRNERNGPGGAGGGGDGRPSTSRRDRLVCGVWKVYGPHAERIVGSPDASLPRAELLDKTGCVAAVRDVSFDVARGEVFVVMGLSGSGKSTLVRMVNRLHDPTAGQIVIDGEDVLTLSSERLRELRRHKISMVFQHFGLFPHRRIVDNVAYGLEVQGVDRVARIRRSQEVLDVVGLGGWGDHYPASCPGGCSSASGSLARSPPTPRSCSSTSRSARSTR
jgi:glycine betaine/proline transport system ATP-binding protein